MAFNKITWVNGQTKLNKNTMDTFQNNIASEFTNINNTIGTFTTYLDEINGEEV